MSTADFRLEQITNYNEASNAMLLVLTNGAVMRSPRTYMHDKTVCALTNRTVSGAFQVVYETSMAPFQNTYEKANADFYPLDGPFQNPSARSNSAVQSTSSTPDTDAQSPPSRRFCTPADHKQVKRKDSQSKQTTAVPKPIVKRETDSNGRQGKREAGVGTKHTKRQGRHERHLERNRVAANKCRERKKQWTEKLEEKKSGLEAIRSILQAEYSRLLQESSQLKSYLISHASCHDPNIDIWISNEASNYARKLSASQLVNGPHLLRRLTGKGLLRMSVKGTKFMRHFPNIQFM